ncbi:MAG TPA: cytochrome C [Thioploca sp.]|nr:cytochrome C [Thioploca sp.]
MKRLIIIFGILSLTGITQAADNNDSQIGQMTHHNMKHSLNDGRISLGLSPEMKQHQLSNMRAHLKAIQTIIGLIVEKKFDDASKIAHSQLGLTEKMKRMCNMFSNNNFIELGLAFHKSGDTLGEALLTRDTNQSLRALQNTVGYCVQCHATFRQ